MNKEISVPLHTIPHLKGYKLHIIAQFMFGQNNSESTNYMTVILIETNINLKSKLKYIRKRKISESLKMK